MSEGYNRLEIELKGYQFGSLSFFIISSNFAA